MTRHPFAPLLYLLLAAALSACAAGARGGTGTPESAQDGLQGTQAPQSTERVEYTPQPYATATQNAAGTLAVLSANETADEKARQDRIFFETQSVYLTQSAYIVQTATAAIPIATARERAMSTSNAMIAANMTQSAAHATQTYAAPYDAATAAYLVERTKWAGFDAFALPLGALTGGIGVMVLALAMVYVLATRPQVHNYPVVETSSSYFVRPWVPISPSGHVTKSLPVTDAEMYKFVEYAVTGLPLGENNMVRAGAWKSGTSDRRKRQDIMTYLDKDCGHIKDHKMTPQGIDYWQDWMDEHTPHPAPSVEVVEIDDSTVHGSVDNDHVDGGEDVVAPQADPYYGQFTPQGETTYTGLTPEKDKE